MHDAVVAAVHHTVVAGAAAALVALAVALFLLWRKRRMAAARSPADGGAAASGSSASTGPLPVIPLADVEHATDGFHPSRVIGQGRHFAVYAAAPGIAAKRMHPHLVLGDPGGRRFPAAVRSLAVPPHPNVTAVIGLSEGPGERVILVERAPAGAVSLDRVLGCDCDDAAHHVPALSWRQRAAVAAGAARGLAHLHAHGVAHGRVRPCNVLVHASSGGGGARWRHATTRVTDYGLAGFLDRRDEARAEDDVYMFGAVLLELLTGRRWDGGRLADWALPHIRCGASLEVLDVVRAGAPADKAEARLLARAARVALACVGNDGRSRPGMAEVSAILSDVEAAYRRRDGALVGKEEEHDDDGDESRLSGCLLGPSRSVHKADMLLRAPPPNGDWALPHIRCGASLEVLDVVRAGAPADKAEARLLARAARVALACVGNDGRSRPGMAEVSAILSDVEAAYRRRDGALVGKEEEHDDDGDESRLSGCLLGPSRSVHKADMLLRAPPVM